MITGTTICYPLVGHPVAQVASPPMINAYFAETARDAVMFPLEVPPQQIDAFFYNLRCWANCGGCSVTVPHKQAAFRAMDTVTDRASAVGSVNIVRREMDGSLHGDMTDGLAFTAALRKSGFECAGTTGAVVGAGGGAGSAIVHALCTEGAAELLLIEQDEIRSQALLEKLSAQYPATQFQRNASDFASLDLIVNASPLGMSPSDPLPFAVESLSEHTLVADIVTKPIFTPLLAAARQRGLKTQDGKAMAEQQLLFQMKHLGLADRTVECGSLPRIAS